jgi:hypothetical protein
VTCLCLSTLFALVIFQMGSHFDWTSLRLSSSCLCLPCRWDYMHASPCLALHLVLDGCNPCAALCLRDISTNPFHTCSVSQVGRGWRLSDLQAVLFCRHGGRSYYLYRDDVMFSAVLLLTPAEHPCCRLCSWRTENLLIVKMREFTHSKAPNCHLKTIGLYSPRVLETGSPESRCQWGPAPFDALKDVGGVDCWCFLALSLEPR